jgi:hypothetical protein
MRAGCGYQLTDGIVKILVERMVSQRLREVDDEACVSMV